MADRWMDDRDRDWRDRDWRQSERFGRGRDRDDDDFDRTRERYESRSFDDRNDDERDCGYGQRSASGRGGMPTHRYERGPVFGERERGDSYTAGRLGGAGQDYSRQDYGRQDYGRDDDDQARRAHDFSHGGRFYGDDGRQPIFREEYGQGGVEYGDVPVGYDSPRWPGQEDARNARYGSERHGYGGRDYQAAQRYGESSSWDEGRRGESDQTWRQGAQRYGSSAERGFSGGTGGYDYERGYGQGYSGQSMSGSSYGQTGSGQSAYGRSGYGQSASSYGQSNRYGSSGQSDQSRYGQASYGQSGYGQSSYGQTRYGDSARGPQAWRGREQGENERDLDRDRERGGRGFLDRAADAVASWFSPGDDSDRDRREMREGHRGRGPRGYRRSNERITEDVHDRLTEDPWVDATNIQVQVENGEVTLTGTVPDRAAKHRAERVVEDVAGVDHVQNNLRVESATGSNPLTSPGREFGDSAEQARRAGALQPTDDANTSALGASSAGSTTTGSTASATGTTSSGATTTSDPTMRGSTKRSS